jgi:hypothetical protein
VAKSGLLRISADNSLHDASTRALSALSNISEIMIARPVVHCLELRTRDGKLRHAAATATPTIENSIGVTAS